ncbi:MAG: DUF512 domain-containing protein [Candidatus Fermentibacteria bacterium]|nr:DUF512 domain-containing protein [Candidatus Fermentibacteria bacterium]
MSFPGTSILKIKPASPASRAGLKAGDRILSCNNQPVRDWVDLLMIASGPTVSLSIGRGPLRRVVNLRRRPGIHWGIELAGSSVRGCRNKCVFCFVDQQPSGLRASLSVKDDDVRYSFMNGTYITLTDQQTDEAISRGFSSLHVSVQTTDPELRGKMLGLPGSAEILPQIDRLARHGVEIQAQIVEVPGWNDGDSLEYTLKDLFSRPNVTILGIVPVGLTKWRSDLVPLSRASKKQAYRTLKTILEWRKKALDKRGTPWVYPADEYYALTGLDIPSVSFYNDSSLAANGIGLLSVMIDQCSDKIFFGEGVIVTGTMAFPYIKKLLAKSNYSVVEVENTLMGPLVGVAGLLGGKDVVNVAKHLFNRDEKIFLPSVMFNHDGVTLDEFTVEMISEETGARVITLDSIAELT